MAETPRNDLADKMNLERQLLGSMRGLSRRVARELRLALAAGQSAPDLALLSQASIEDRLKQHYRRCERAFGTNLQDQMVDEIKPGKVEREFIQIEILRVLDNRAENQSRLISRTMQNLGNSAFQRAANLVARNDDLTHRDLPTLTANLFLTATMAQAGAVAVTETQMGTETCKGIEARMLVGQKTTEVKRRADVLTAKKTWRSQGDSRVRTQANGSKFDHLDADGQTVDGEKPFIVGGEALLWPGDISLGASPGNIIRCRCSAIYDVQSFSRLRRSWLGRLFEDVLKPFRQTESENIVSSELGL